MLAQIPLYVFPNFYVMFGVLLLDSPVSGLISHFAREIDIFSLYPREIMLRFKCLSVASRSSFHYSIGGLSKHLSAVEVMSLVGIPRSTGRSDGIPNVEKRKKTEQLTRAL
jgi:hypothetical protein